MGPTSMAIDDRAFPLTARSSPDISRATGGARSLWNHSETTAIAIMAIRMTATRYRLLTQSGPQLASLTCQTLLFQLEQVREQGSLRPAVEALVHILVDVRYKIVGR